MESYYWHLAILLILSFSIVLQVFESNYIVKQAIGLAENKVLKLVVNSTITEPVSEFDKTHELFLLSKSTSLMLSYDPSFKQVLDCSLNFKTKSQL